MERPLPDGLRQESGGLPVRCVGHEPPHAPVQAVDGVDLPAGLGPEEGGEAVRRAVLTDRAGGLEAYEKAVFMV